MHTSPMHILVVLHAIRVPTFPGGMAPDSGLPEKLLEALRAVDVVVTFEDRVPQALAEAPRAQEDGNFIAFQFTDEAGLVNKELIVVDDLLIIRNRVVNFLRHNMLAPL